MEDVISHLEALALARSGRLQDARRMSAVAVEIAKRSGRRERAGLFEAATAVWEAFYGNAAAARQSATKALELGRGREVDYAAAFALALSGDLPQSRALAEDLAREFPEDTSVQFMYLPTLRALFSLDTHDAAAAIQALETASLYDLALGGVGFIGRFGGLYPIYVRGQAYLAADQPAAGRRRVPADSRSSEYRARRSDGRPRAPAAGAGARGCRATPRRRRASTATCSRCGRTPTRTLGFSKKHGRNTPGCDDRMFCWCSLSQCVCSRNPRSLSGLRTM